MKNVLFFVLAGLPFINAQYGNPGGGTSTTTSASSTSSSTAASASSTVHRVDAGQDGFTFTPDTLTVAPGEKVEFHFFPGGPHSATEASFDNPCHPINGSSFNSGFVSSTTAVFTLTINDTSPLWFYCGQIGHCQAGMVGVINPPAGGQNTLASFKQAAANAKLSTLPASVQGGIFGAANESPSSTGSQSASNTASTTSSTSASTNTGSQMGTALGMGIVMALSCFVSLSMI